MIQQKGPLKLTQMLAQVHGLTDGNKIIEAPLFEATGAQKQVLKEFYEAKLERVRVTGVKLTGSEKNLGALITGTFDGMSINTRPIKFSGTTYGFEEMLELICSTMIDEVYQFVFENKKAVLEIAFENAEDIENDELVAEGLIHVGKEEVHIEDHHQDVLKESEEAEAIERNEGVA